MTTTLGDTLLVLLEDRSRNAPELHQLHRDALGPRHEVDLKRVSATLTRQERLGHLRTVEELSRGRRVWMVTEAGRRRQRSWLLDVNPATDHEDVLIHALLAVVATDRQTFETVIGSCLAAIEVRRLRAVAHRAGPLSAADARTEFDDALLATTLDWLRDLRGRKRERDQPT